MQFLENTQIMYSNGFKKCNWILLLELSGLCIRIQPELCIFLAKACVDAHSEILIVGLEAWLKTCSDLSSYHAKWNK